MKGRVPDDLRGAHDRVMAMKPIEYRGYLIKSISHAGQPFWLAGEFVFWGFIPVVMTGKYAGCHAAPGATWGRTIGSIKTMIDCLHEAGHEPDPEDRSASHAEWGEKFWALMEERREKMSSAGFTAKVAGDSE